MKISFIDNPKAVLGCIQIGTDFVMDAEGPALISLIPNVELRLQKTNLISTSINLDTYQKSAKYIGQAVECLKPYDRCTVIGLACTSFAFSIGSHEVDKQFVKIFYICHYNGYGKVANCCIKNSKRYQRSSFNPIHRRNIKIKPDLF